MRYRVLGKTGLSVSALGFGASPLGGSFGPVDQDLANRTVRAALDAGVNLYDTSPLYGNSEEVLGRALAGVPRDSYFLSTKCGRYVGGNSDFSADRVTRSVDTSLSRLGLDHIDILLCHDIEFVPLGQVIDEALPALRKVVEAGKVRFLGVSGYPLKIYTDVLKRTDLDVILSYCHYTLYDTSYDSLLPYLHERGVGAMNAAPVAMGLLTDDPASTLPDWHPAPPALRQAATEAAALCKRHGVSLPDVAVSFTLARPDIATTLVGMVGPEQVARNVAALAAPDPELLRAVRACFSGVRDYSWPSGLLENNDAPDAGNAA